VRASGIALALLAAAACTREQWQRAPSPDDAVAAVPWFATMKRSVSIQPYQMNRDPVPGTVPITGAEPPGVRWSPADAKVVDARRNPVDRTSESVNRGKNRYDIYCQVCHGPAGQGNGPVAAKIGGNVRNLTLPEVRAYTEGRIYAAVRFGFGLMPPYGDKLVEADRWNVVNYVRVLQGAPGGQP